MAQLRRCVRCLFPETHEALTFDENGVCSICRTIEFKKSKIDWTARETELRRIFDKYRGKADYDCIIPFSGGKDSTFVAYTTVVKYGLKPLIVSFDHGFYRPNHLQNVERTLKSLGADYLRFRPNWKVVQKLMVESFVRKGDFCWHCHSGIFTYPLQIAINFKVPLVVWGEPTAEHTSYYSYEELEEYDEEHFNRSINLGINAEDMVGFLGGSVTTRDLKPFTFPPQRELRALGCRNIYLGSYIPWDIEEHVKFLKKELGWHGDWVEGTPPEYDYDKIECAMQGVRDYVKYMKRGYGRTNQLMARELRNGRVTMERAKELIAKYDGKRPASLEVFLEYSGLSEKEFFDIVASHVVDPWTHDPAQDERGPEPADMKSWDRTCRTCTGCDASVVAPAESKA